MERIVPMSVRRIVVEVDTDGLNVAEFCRQHGISRWFFYELRRRYAVAGEAGLVPRSRAPKRVANRTPDRVENLIVDARKRLVEDGLDAGAATIRFHLTGQLDPVPSESTIWRVLVRRGFVTPHPDRAPKHAYRRFEADRVNECWQIDDTGWLLADGTEVKIINLLDDRSRTAVGSKAVVVCTGDAAYTAFCEAADEWGLPAWVLADNAPAFKYRLAEAASAHGVRSSSSRPYHPQTCGKVERFHQTLKKWLSSRPRARSISELQDQLDTFRHVYNYQRPHRSLGRRYPAVVHATGPHSGPADRPLASRTRIHHVTVLGGRVEVNSDWAIAVGNLWEGQAATVIITGHHCHVLISGTLVRQLTLDPDRRYQPLHPRPGRPPVRNDPRHV